MFSMLVLLGSDAIHSQAPVYGYRVVKQFPHQTSSYTEGLFFRDGLFYEGTGLEGHSKLLAVDPLSSTVIRSFALPSEYYGEGIADWGDRIYQLTWKSHICFVYDRATFRPITQYAYSGEGWGMTHDDHELITSDGTSILRFRDPVTFYETHRLDVHDGAQVVTKLNELEFVKGEIYANVWLTDRVARISPLDGHVIAWIDFKGLQPDSARSDAEAVLNGIAFDPAGGRLFVTGKDWPTVFQVELVEPPVHRAPY